MLGDMPDICSELSDMAEKQLTPLDPEAAKVVLSGAFAFSHNAGQ